MNVGQDDPLENAQDLCGEVYACEMCGKEHPIEVSVSTDDGCPLCPDCDAMFRKAFAACDHDWMPHIGTWGPGVYCKRCSGFVEDENPLGSPPAIGSGPEG
jgi:hypothetical protein